jgi:Uma2 family endonuclease
MTILLIEAQNIPLKVNVPALLSMTDEQFYEFCQANIYLRIERTATGEIIVRAPAFSNVIISYGYLAAQLWNWSEQDSTGIGFYNNAGFILPNGAIRSPSAAWIRSDRWNTLTEDQQSPFVRLCPDFVVELRSASDILSSLQTKMQEYIDNGASLGFLIDRQNHQVHLYHPHQEPKILDNPETVSGEPELPGFSLHMAKIW